MNDALLSGEDSGLENTWDEICVQIQYQQSHSWGAYDQTVFGLAAAEVEKLLPHEREAVWLQTPEGDDWDSEDESKREPSPVVSDDIVEYLISQHVYSAAGNWSNPRIRKYLERRD